MLKNKAIFTLAFIFTSTCSSLAFAKTGEEMLNEVIAGAAGMTEEQICESLLSAVIVRISARPKLPSAEVLVAHGAAGDVRFRLDHTFPALGEAWRALDGDEVDQNLIWGDVATTAAGSVHYMNYADAMEYCIDLNPRAERAAIWAALKAGQAPERGIYLPLRSDFARLRRQLGSTAQDSAFETAGYAPQVLPHLDHWFWSSSVHPDDSFYAYVFNGRTGGIGYDYRDDAGYNAVRCVARR